MPVTHLRIRVQHIRIQPNRRDHDPKNIQPPPKTRDHEVESVLEREAEQDQSCDHERRAEPDDSEARFGLEPARVPAHVPARKEVVQPVADGLAEDGSDDGGEVEEAWWGVLLVVGSTNQWLRGSLKGSDKM
jgi:hypothetical protein